MPGNRDRFFRVRAASHAQAGLSKGTPPNPNSCKNLRCLLVLACVALSVWLARAGDEIVVGHGAAGQLKVEIGFEQPLGLPVSVFPGSPGYATGEAGFHSAAIDEPANDFFQLSPTADFRLILLAKDAGM